MKTLSIAALLLSSLFTSAQAVDSAKPANPSGYGGAVSDYTSSHKDGNFGKIRNDVARNDVGPGEAAQVQAGREYFGSTPNPPSK